MTAKLRKIFGWTALILLPIGYVVGSEIYYAGSISPRGISTARDFFNCFGEPREIRMVQRDGRNYYEFGGSLPGRFVLALPSSPPAYVFDEQGQFTDWCRDPGDIPRYRETWPLVSTNQVEIRLVRDRFGL